MNARLKAALKVEWIDMGQEPRSPPNPKFPNGLDLDLRHDPNADSCSTPLPYPAKRIGMYRVRCPLCGFTASCTTAGRPDDPRSITIPCRPRGTRQ